MKRGNPTQSGRMQGRALLVTFLWFGIPTLEKSDSPGGRNQNHQQNSLIGLAKTLMQRNPPALCNGQFGGCPTIATPRRAKLF
ncbi:hypothetical protein thsps21_35030 [Pseudomonas sp. No.21]|nr:hypothetical protein TUM20249_18020 [Pseudomonas tohonis]